MKRVYVSGKIGEGCITSQNVMYLDYKRDVYLDLKFD